MTESNLPASKASDLAGPVPDSSQLRDGTAELAVRFGANLQPGQDVLVIAELEALELGRRIVEVAYANGARYVDLSILDTATKRARLEHVPAELVPYTPPWLEDRLTRVAAGDGAVIFVTPFVASGELDDVDPAKLGADAIPPGIAAHYPLAGDRRYNYTIVPAPTESWAQVVFPDLASEAAVKRLESALIRILRLDESDPTAAWDARLTLLEDVGVRLTALELDEVRLVGPGTDLRIGLLPQHRFTAVRRATQGGIPFCANVPTEEVLTAPDPLRADGYITATKPLDLEGMIVEGIRIEFRQGVAVKIDADRGEELLNVTTSVDEGARRLGEFALVDKESRIGQLETVFRNTLLDENAASHLAFGYGPTRLVAPAIAERVNRSRMHVDFMVGGPELSVRGRTAQGEELELLDGGAWRI